VLIQLLCTGNINKHFPVKQVTFQDIITPGEPVWGPHHWTSHRRLSSQSCHSKLPKNQPTTHEKGMAGQRELSWHRLGNHRPVQFTGTHNPALGTVHVVLTPAAHLPGGDGDRRGTIPAPGTTAPPAPGCSRSPGRTSAPATALPLIHAVL